MSSRAPGRAPVVAVVGATGLVGRTMLQVLVERDELIRALENLVENALKYGASGKRIDVTLTRAPTRTGMAEARLAVRDYGPGIAPEVKANVFERFAAQGQGNGRAGAGLGLALVNRFIELHDGWVEVDTGSGSGTLVRCHLPRRLPEDEPSPREASVA